MGSVQLDESVVEGWVHDNKVIPKTNIMVNKLLYFFMVMLLL